MQYNVFQTIHISFVQLAKCQSQQPIKKLHNRANVGKINKYKLRRIDIGLLWKKRRAESMTFLLSV